VLRACNRVLKSGAPLVFFVVAVAAGLAPRDTARAIGAGPEYVDAGPGYPSLMEAAGFVNVEVIDVTDDYAVTLSDSIQARNAERPQLEDLIGVDKFIEGQSSRRRELAAVHEGLLRRHLVVALRP
jgi:hypothetical protein